MDTNRFRDNLSDYMENRLSAAERGAMDAYLSASPDAQADATTLNETLSALRDWGTAPGEEPPLFFRDNVMSAIERTGTRSSYWNTAQSPVPLWERLFPNMGRLAFAAGAGGIVAVAGFLVATNALTPASGLPVATVGASLSRVATGLVLPYMGQVAENDVADVAPRLVISTGRTLTPDAHTAYDFAFWLENAERGSAKFTVLGGAGEPGLPDAGKTFSYAGIPGGAARTVRVAFDAPKPSALAIKVRWTAAGVAHERYLFVPTSPAPQAEGAAVASTFTLAEMPLIDALKQVATETNTAITLEEVPNPALLRARIAADGKESVSVALRRGLEPLGLRVSRSPAGVLVTPK